MVFSICNYPNIRTRRIIVSIIFLVFLFLAVIILNLFSIQPNKFLAFSYLILTIMTAGFTMKVLYKKNGEIEFDESEIIIKNKENFLKIDLENGDRVELNYSRQNNYSKIYDTKIRHNNKLLEDVFTLRGKKEIKKFTDCIIKYYEKGYNFSEKEEMGAKVFLLKGNMKYNEIQEIKEKYNIEWIK